MGTLIVLLILIAIVGTIVFSLVKKRINAKKKWKL